MAIRVSATSHLLERSANLPANASFTFMADAVVLVDQGSTVVQPLVGGFNASFTDGFGFLWNTDAPASTLALAAFIGGTANSSVLFTSRPAVGRAFCYYVKCSGGSAGQFEAGWRYSDSAWVVATAQLSGATAQIAHIRVSTIASAYYVDSLTQNVKLWNRALSAAELDLESRSAEVVSRIGVNLYAPMPHHNDVFDRGPFGRNWTRAAGLATGYFEFKRPAKALRRPAAYSPAPPVTAVGSLGQFDPLLRLDGWF